LGTQSLNQSPKTLIVVHVWVHDVHGGHSTNLAVSKRMARRWRVLEWTRSGRLEAALPGVLEHAFYVVFIRLSEFSVQVQMIDEESHTLTRSKIGFHFAATKVG
jgi:hypothetical protein